MDECQAENQKFTIEPENQSATIGTKVLLPCRVVGKVGELQWTKDDFGLGTDRNLTGFDRYAMVGDEMAGEYTLQIESLELDDDAKYQCQVSPGAGTFLPFISLTKLPPSGPILNDEFSIVSTRRSTGDSIAFRHPDSAGATEATGHHAGRFHPGEGERRNRIGMCIGGRKTGGNGKNWMHTKWSANDARG